MIDVTYGVCLGLGAVLLLAGIAKLRRVQGLEATLVAIAPAGVWRLPGVDSRRAARAVTAVELLCAAALLTGRAVVLAAAAALLWALTLAAHRAMAKATPCSCFGPRTDSHRAGIVRTAGLAAIATTALAVGDIVVAWPLAVAVAAGVVAWALMPELRAGVRVAAAEPAHTEAAGGASRRSFLAGAAVATAALLMGAVPAGADPPTPPRSCQARFDLCYGCRHQDHLGE